MMIDKKSSLFVRMLQDVPLFSGCAPNEAKTTAKQKRYAGLRSLRTFFFSKGLSKFHPPSRLILPAGVKEQQIGLQRQVFNNPFP